MSRRPAKKRFSLGIIRSSDRNNHITCVYDCSPSTFLVANYDVKSKINSYYACDKKVLLNRSPLSGVIYVGKSHQDIEVLQDVRGCMFNHIPLAPCDAPQSPPPPLISDLYTQKHDGYKMGFYNKNSIFIDGALYDFNPKVRLSVFRMGLLTCYPCKLSSKYHMLGLFNDHVILGKDTGGVFVFDTENLNQVKPIGSCRTLLYENKPAYYTRPRKCHQNPYLPTSLLVVNQGYTYELDMNTSGVTNARPIGCSDKFKAIKWLSAYTYLSVRGRFDDVILSDSRMPKQYLIHVCNTEQIRKHVGPQDITTTSIHLHQDYIITTANNIIAIYL